MHIADMIREGAKGKEKNQGEYGVVEGVYQLGSPYYNKSVTPSMLVNIRKEGKQDEVLAVCALGAAYLGGLPAHVEIESVWARDHPHLHSMLYDLLDMNDRTADTLEDIARYVEEKYPNACFVPTEKG